MMNNHAMNHSIPLPPPPATTDPKHARPDRVKRPEITSTCTSEDWGFFEEMWSEYKTTTKLAGQELTMQLTNCCDIQLRQDLFRSFGTTTGKTEDDILIAIKNLAVRKENLTVARTTLIKAKQDRDEPVKIFVARLKGLASMCDYSMTVNCAGRNEITVNFAHVIIRDVLVTGMADAEIQADVLGHTEQNQALDTLTSFIEAKEVGKQSYAHFSGAQSADAVRSSYKRQNTTPPTAPNFRPSTNRPQPASPTQFTTDKAAVCGWCGRKGHGNFRNPLKRLKVCPAANTTCSTCGVRHHFAIVCRTGSSTHCPSAAAVTDDSQLPYTDNNYEEAILLSSYGVSSNQ